MTALCVIFVNFRPLSPLRLLLDKRRILSYMRGHA
jgi:hypothetical protein